MTQQLTGRPVLVLGVGRSGTAAAHALLDAGADVRIVDAGVQLGGGALVRLGTPLDRAGLVDGVELVVTSPGIPPTAGALVAAARRGVPVWSEPELAWQLSGGRTRIVGITGTNGKTTTTELVAAVLGVPAGGNIGTPLVTLLSAPDPPSLVVAELSSFQLHHCVTLRTDVGVLLNVADDHLDWHGSRAAYRRAKAAIWRGQRPGGRDWAVVGVDDPGVREVIAEHPPPAGILGFTIGEPAAGQVGVRDGWVITTANLEGSGGAGSGGDRFAGQRPANPAPAAEAVPVVRVTDLAIRGPHNLANVCAAVAAAQAAGADPATLGPALAGYRTGRHRLESVAQHAGVTFVDDSKATNPHAAAAAIASFGSVVWIAGGLAKGVDMAPLDPLLQDRVRAVVTMGADGPLIAARARRLGIPAVEARVLEAAVRVAADLARPGDTVLLAPACASMDQFRDYAERGEAFAMHVRRLIAGRAPAGDAADTNAVDEVERTDAHGGA